MNMIEDVSLGYGIIKIGKVKSVDYSDDTICFVLNEQYNTGSSFDNLEYAYIMCTPPETISDGDKCLLVKENDVSTDWFCIGFVSQAKIQKKEKKEALKQTQESFSLTSDYDGDVTSGITGGPKSLFLFNDKNITLESKGVDLKIERGNLNIVGEKDSSSNDIEDYSPINQLYARAQKFYFKAGGFFNITAGKMKVDLSTSTLSSTIPGAGASEVFHVNAIEGDVRFDIGLGDIILNNYNFSYLNKIELRCGSILHPTASGLDLEAFSAKFYLNTVDSAVQSKLEFTTGGTALLKSTNDIDITSVAGKITLDSTQAMTLSSLTTMELSSNLGLDISTKASMSMSTNTDMTLKGLVKILVDSAMIEIKGQILDMSKSGQINMGPKSVAPTGTGPLCGLPYCLFTGAPHSGPMAQ